MLNKIATSALRRVSSTAPSHSDDKSSPRVTPKILASLTRYSAVGSLISFSPKIHRALRNAYLFCEPRRVYPLSVRSSFMFFPSILSGPISRAQKQLPQYFESRNFDYDNAVSACKLMLLGGGNKIVSRRPSWNICRCCLC